MLAQEILIVLLYAAIGAGIKYIDQAYDEGAFSKHSAFVLAAVEGMLMAYLMAIDTPFSTVFYAAMIAGVFVSRKVDNKAFAIGVCSNILFVGLLSFFYTYQFLLVPFFLFFFATIIDEVCDNIGHKKGSNWYLSAFFHYRPVNDLVMFGLVLSGTFSWFYLLPYFTFTLAYITVEKYYYKELVGDLQTEEVRRPKRINSRKELHVK